MDCDPGCDDALALLLALRSGVFEGIDILTVAGNVGVNQTTSNALRILYLGTMGMKSKPTVKVYKGCSASLDGVRPSAASVHGRDGLGDVPVSVLLGENGIESFHRTVTAFLEPKISAVQRYIELFQEISEGNGKNDNSQRDLVCTGPLTNVATALIQLGPRNYAAFWKIWSSVTIMGGALGVQGNISYASEFNAHADPLALRIVLESFRGQNSKSDEIPVPVFVTLDSTEKVRLDWHELESIKAPRSKRLPYIKCMLQKYFLFHGQYAAKEDERKNAIMKIDRKNALGSGGLKCIPRFCFLHDPLAMWVAIKKDRGSIAKLLTDTTIYVSTDLGAARGKTFLVEDRPFLFAADEPDGKRPGHDRTRVRYLDPSKGRIPDGFKEQLKSALS